MSKTINLGVLKENIIRLDKADYWFMVGGYDRAGNLVARAKKELGEAFADVDKARISVSEFTGESTYKPICDRLRAKGYEITKGEDPDAKVINVWLEEEE